MATEANDTEVRIMGRLLRLMADLSPESADRILSWARMRLVDGPKEAARTQPWPWTGPKMPTVTLPPPTSYLEAIKRETHTSNSANGD